MPDISVLARSPLFAGLGPAELQAVADHVRPRSFAPGERLCSAGEPSRCLWLITSGLVHIDVPRPGAATSEVVARRRRGEMIGAETVITGEPRTASVVAALPTTTLELDGERFGELARRFPQVLVNLIGVQSERLVKANVRGDDNRRGEAVALLSGPALGPAVTSLVDAARAATPRSVMVLDRRLSFAGALTAIDDLTSQHAIVLLPGELEPDTVVVLLDEVDRVIALVGSGAEAAQLGAVSRAPAVRGRHVEAVLIGDEAQMASRQWPADSPIRVVRSCARSSRGEVEPGDLAWLARHVTRTKLGLSLGAGGAKGYAHVGVLEVLERAGYSVDYVAGSSIGAIVGSYLALGMDAATIDTTLRTAFDVPTVAELFRTSLAGGSTGLARMTQLLRETTAERTFADTQIPLAVMAVDLTDRAPAPIRDGPLWDALLAATALAGVFPPHERAGHRLVDGLALVPVPTGSVLDDGADIAVSVNLMGAETLANWPAQPAPAPPPERRRRAGMLDTLLEVMDLSQLDTSIRHAELADVVITPRFGPCHWRDFHLADLFLAAGREAALEQMPALQALSTPLDLTTTSEGDGIARTNAVRI